MYSFTNVPFSIILVKLCDDSRSPPQFLYVKINLVINSYQMNIQAVLGMNYIHTCSNHYDKVLKNLSLSMDRKNRIFQNVILKICDPYPNYS